MFEDDVCDRCTHWHPHFRCRRCNCPHSMTAAEREASSEDEIATMDEVYGQVTYEIWARRSRVGKPIIVRLRK